MLQCQKPSESVQKAFGKCAKFMLILKKTMDFRTSLMICKDFILLVFPSICKTSIFGVCQLAVHEDALILEFLCVSMCFCECL
jgi:hypothetical protein